MLVLSTLYVSSCFKDNFDLSKLSDSLSYSPSLAAPIAYAKLTLSKMIKPRQDTIEYNGDTIRFVYRNDSIFTFTVDQIFDIATQQVISKQFLIESPTVSSFNIQSQLNSNRIFDEAPSGNPPFFPGFPATNYAGLDTVNIAQNFSSVTFADGSVTISITNNYPVSITAGLTFEYKNTDNTNFASFSFPYEIGAGQMVTADLNLAGRRMTNNLIINLLGFGLNSAEFPVFNPATDGIGFNLVSSSSLSVQSGEIIFPDQTISEEQILDFTVDNEERLKHLTLRSGKLNFTVQTGIQETLELNLNFSSITKNGQALVKTINIAGSGGTKTNTIDLTGYSIDLTKDTTEGGQDYNHIPVHYELRLISSGVPKPFNFNDQLSFSFQIEDLKYKYADGYFLGQKRNKVELDSIDLEFDFFDRIDGGLKLTDPQIRITASNSVGLPFRIDTLNLLGKSSFGTLANFDFPVINAPVPTQLQIGQTVHELYNFDKTTTNIVDFLALPPRYIYFSGSSVTNPEGYLGGAALNFVTDSARFNVGLEVEIPLEIQTDRLIVVDTVALDVSGTFDMVDLATLYIITKNGFPFSFDLSLIPLAKNTLLPYDEITINALQSAEVDTKGIVTVEKESRSNVRLTKQQINNLANSTKIVVRASLKTANNGTVPVKLLTRYNLFIKLALKADLNFKP